MTQPAPTIPEEVTDRYARMRADLLAAGYVDVAHDSLPPGQRVRHRGEQYSEAAEHGTGVVLAVMQQTGSSWSRSMAMADIELIVLHDKARFGSRLSQLANYHLIPVHP